MGNDAPAGDTGLAALIQHSGYAAQNTQRCKQECPGQGDLSVKGGGDMVNDSANMAETASHESGPPFR